jgi:hypothetical protein
MDETKCAEDFELNSMEEDWDVIEIDVQIVDKIIPHTMIDEGSSINVMPLSTLNKLGLSITEPSFSVIHVADHRTCKPSGRIRNLNVNTGGENYKLTFEMLPIKLRLTSKKLFNALDQACMISRTMERCLNG